MHINIKLQQISSLVCQPLDQEQMKHNWGRGSPYGLENYN